MRRIVYINDDKLVQLWMDTFSESFRAGDVEAAAMEATTAVEEMLEFFEGGDPLKLYPLHTLTPDDRSMDHG